jgi:hypothetical protein
LAAIGLDAAVVAALLGVAAVAVPLAAVVAAFAAVVAADLVAATVAVPPAAVALDAAVVAALFAGAAVVVAAAAGGVVLAAAVAADLAPPTLAVAGAAIGAASDLVDALAVADRSRNRVAVLLVSAAVPTVARGRCSGPGCSGGRRCTGRSGCSLAATGELTVDPLRVDPRILSGDAATVPRPRSPAAMPFRAPRRDRWEPKPRASASNVLPSIAEYSSLTCGRGPGGRAGTASQMTRGTTVA